MRSPAANEGERWGQFAAGLYQGPLTLMKRSYQRGARVDIQGIPDIAR
jgi:hypothetical protein